MDHQIKVKKKSRKVFWISLFLILLIIGASLFFLSLNARQNLRVAELNAAIQAEQPTTATIESGPLKVVVDNLSGTVRSNQSVDLKWKSAGTVQSINVKVGDTVSQGTVLAELDPATLPVDVQNGQVELDSANTAMEKLKNNAESVSQAVSNLVSAQKKLQDAQTSFDSLDPSRANSDAVQLAYETYLNAENNYGSAVAKFEALRDAPADSASRIKRLGDVGGYRSVRDNALAEYRRYLGEGQEMERLIRGAALELAKATLEDTQFKYDKASNGPTDAEISAAQAKIDAALNKMNASKLIAPFNGQVTQLETKVNDVLSTTGTSMTTTAIRIEDLSSLYIDVTVSELRVNQIKTGQQADIVFAGIPNKTYHGTVTTVADTGKTSSLNVTFTVTIKIDDADDQVKSGMTAAVSMTVANIPDTLIAPLAAFELKDGKLYVSLKKADGSFEKVAVEVGVVSGNKAQILGDTLKAGNEVEVKIVQTEETEEFPMGGAMVF